MDLIRTLVCLAVLALATPATADGRLAPQGGTITSVGATAGGGLTGGATGGPAYLGLITTCSSGQVLAWSGSAWACTANGGGVATVTATAGGGVTIGGTTSNPTVGLQTSCGSGKLLVWSGSAWGCSTFSEASSTLSIPEAVSLTGANITILQSNVLTLTAFASASSALNSRVSGTVNVTAGDLSASGASFVSNTTKSGGAHILTDYGLLSEANGQSSAEHAYAIWAYGHGGTVDNYDFVGFGGQLLQNDAATFGSTVAVAGALTENTRRVFSNPGSGLARDGTNAYQINLNITPTTCSGQFISAISSLGVGTCASAGGPGTGTANALAYWATTSTLGSAGITVGTDYTYTSGAGGKHLFANAGGNLATLSTNGWQLPSSAGFMFASSSLPGTTDARLYRSGVNALAIDNGAAGAASLSIAGAGFADGGARIHTAVGTGLAQSNQTVSLAINSGTTQTCTAGQFATSLTGVGIQGCATALTGTMVSGTIPVGSAAGTLTTSSETDNGTTFKSGSTFAVTISSGATTTGALTTPFGVQLNGSIEDVDSALQLQLGHASSGVTIGLSSTPTASILTIYGTETVKSTATFEAQILVKGAIKATGAWAGRFTASGTTATNTLPTPSGTYFCLTDTDETTRGYAHSVASTTLSWSSLTSGNHYEFICIDN